MAKKLNGYALWRHKKKGTIYRILTVGLLEKNLEPCVVYTEECDDDVAPVWVRPVAEFLDRRFEPEPALDLEG